MKKLFPIILLIVLAITVSPVLAAGPSEASDYDENIGMSVLTDEPLEASDYDETIGISVPTDAVLDVDEVINSDILGRRHIRMWQRVIDGVIHVQNDYIRIDVNLDTNEVVLYEQQWRDIEFESVEIKPFEPPEGEYIWKKVVLFVDEEDRIFLGEGSFFDGSSLEDNYLYTFFGVVEYPLVCWEVRYTDGTTVMYDLDGNPIGRGTIVAPSAQGYLASGVDDNWLYEQAWIVARNNANYWYSRWTASTTCVYDPRPQRNPISRYVRDPNYIFYYAIGHGDARRYGWYEKEYKGQREEESEWYDYYTADQAVKDMGNRTRPCALLLWFIATLWSTPVMAHSHMHSEREATQVL